MVKERTVKDKMGSVFRRVLFTMGTRLRVFLVDNIMISKIFGRCPCVGCNAEHVNHHFEVLRVVHRYVWDETSRKVVVVE